MSIGSCYGYEPLSHEQVTLTGPEQLLKNGPLANGDFLESAHVPVSLRLDTKWDPKASLFPLPASTGLSYSFIL